MLFEQRIYHYTENKVYFGIELIVNLYLRRKCLKSGCTIQRMLKVE